MSEWEPPRCEHGAILLGCPRDDCEQQNAYVAAQDAAMTRWENQQQERARRLVRTALGPPL